MTAFERIRDALMGLATDQRLGLAVLLMAILFIAGVALYVLYLFSPKGRVRGMIDARSSADRSAIAVDAAVVGLLLLGFIGANVYMDRPATCRSCHTSSYEQRLAASPHSRVSCADCHSPGGVTGVVRKDITYGRWVWVYGVTKQVPKPKSAPIGDGACLGCHAAVRQGVAIRAGVRVRHSDFLGTGTQCSDCHSGLAHTEGRPDTVRSRMTLCLACHNGTRARAKCDLCHVSDMARTPVGYPKVRVADRFDVCYRCHNERPCTRCHGIRMPHVPGYGVDAAGKPGLHARDGFAKRELCWRCHHAPNKPFVPASEGCRCHGVLGRQHGGAPWVNEHWREATGQKGGSNARCFDCHGTDLCSRCHPSSYRDRYAPQPGKPGDYSRGVARDPLAEDW